MVRTIEMEKEIRTHGMDNATKKNSNFRRGKIKHIRLTEMNEFNTFVHAMELVHVPSVGNKFT